MGADWIALSFVQRAADVLEARKLVNNRAAVLSKIEKPACVTDLQDVIAASDGLMVARGDLGVEMAVQDVPAIQKRIVRACRNAGKPVIVATQMLESMIEAPVPTRAEVSDVATAIYEGADAVMLSAESAAGNYPHEAVTTMNAVAERIERDEIYAQVIAAARTPSRERVADAITVALLAARERPLVPILALTPQVRTARRLSLVWGLHCAITGEVERFKMAVVSAARVAREYGFGTDKDRIIVTAGIPFGKPGTTNILRIAPVSEKLIYEGEPE